MAGIRHNSNEFVAADLRRASGELARGWAGWTPTFQVLAKAEETAVRNFLSVGSSPDRDDMAAGKEAAIGRAFASTSVDGVAASALLSTLLTPLSHGFAWFETLFSHALGRGQAIYARGETARRSAVIPDFRALATSNRVAGAPDGSAVFRTHLDELDRLEKAVARSPLPISIRHASVATAAMLLSPLLCPPADAPDEDPLALAIEWHLWQNLAPSLVGRAKDDRLGPDLDAIFRRLKAIENQALAAAVDLAAMPAMTDLSWFRRHIDQLGASSAALKIQRLRLSLSVRWPPAVATLLTEGPRDGRRSAKPSPLVGADARL